MSTKNAWLSNEILDENFDNFRNTMVACICARMPLSMLCKIITFVLSRLDNINKMTLGFHVMALDLLSAHLVLTIVVNTLQFLSNAYVANIRGINF